MEIKIILIQIKGLMNSRFYKIIIYKIMLKEDIKIIWTINNKENLIKTKSMGKEYIK